jgi:hypothetical protein
VVVEPFSVDTHSKSGGAIGLSSHWVEVHVNSIFIHHLQERSVQSLGRGTCKFHFYSPPSRD